MHEIPSAVHILLLAVKQSKVYYREYNVLIYDSHISYRLWRKAEGYTQL